MLMAMFAILAYEKDRNDLVLLCIVKKYSNKLISIHNTLGSEVNSMCEILNINHLAHAWNAKEIY